MITSLIRWSLKGHFSPIYKVRPTNTLERKTPTKDRFSSAERLTAVLRHLIVIGANQDSTLMAWITTDSSNPALMSRRRRERAVNSLGDSACTPLVGTRCTLVDCAQRIGHRDIRNPHGGPRQSGVVAHDHHHCAECVCLIQPTDHDDHDDHDVDRGSLRPQLSRTLRESQGKDRESRRSDRCQQ